jgi:hypothetical protein
MEGNRMTGEVIVRDHARRNRLIAIAAGAITVVAIVLGFAGDVLGLPWHWMRPAAELLLLGELVGLVVLERHQLFEPVHENVGAMRTRVEEIHAIVSESARNSGQVTAGTSTPEVLRMMTRIIREALARDQQSPQILRIARLTGRMFAPEQGDLVAEFREYLNATSAYYVSPGSPPDARGRRWSVRLIFAFSELANFNMYIERATPMVSARPSNGEAKILVRPRIEAMLSPVITDRDAVVVFDDAVASFQWAFWYQGPQYRALMERWFDDLWASIPDSYLIYSRNGFNQSAIDRIRKELEAIESSQAAQTAERSNN